MNDYYKEKKEQQVKLVDMISPNLRNYFKNKNKSIVAHITKEFEMRQTAQRFNQTRSQSLLNLI